MQCYKNYRRKTMKYIKILLALMSINMICSCTFIANTAWHGNNFKRSQQSALFRENMDTHIDSLINIDGYYAGIAEDSTYIKYTNPPFFYRDGEFGKLYLDDEYLYLKKRDIDITGKYSFCSGAYTIKGDTIIADEYTTMMWSNWLWYKYKFVVIDRNTLPLIEASYGYSSDNAPENIKKNIKKKKEIEKIRVWKVDQIYKFVPVKGLPKSDLWIKRKKWMWENKEEWKRYKKSLKAKDKKK